MIQNARQYRLCLKEPREDRLSVVLADSRPCGTPTPTHTPVTDTCQHRHHCVSTVVSVTGVCVGVGVPHRHTPVTDTCRHRHHRVSTMVSVTGVCVNVGVPHRHTPVTDTCRHRHHRVSTMVSVTGVCVSVGVPHRHTPVTDTCRHRHHRVSTMVSVTGVSVGVGVPHWHTLPSLTPADTDTIVLVQWWCVTDTTVLTQPQHNMTEHWTLLIRKLSQTLFCHNYVNCEAISVGVAKLLCGPRLAEPW